MELHNIDVYVPLGLEERKQQQKVNGDFSPGQNIQEQVTITPISEDQFFQDVLRAWQSPTSQGKSLAIIGEAGAGKTTRLKMIADFILEEDLGLPIWVPLRRLTSGLGNYLQQWLNATSQNNLLADLQTQFQAGKVWLLLDGLDEMTDRITVDHGDLLQGWWSEARFIVSCRVNVWDNYRESFHRFDVYRNLEFQAEQVQLFIQKFFAKAEQVKAGEELWLALQEENHSRLQDVIGNPLRLFLLCWTWYQGERNLPETQAGFYEQLVEQLYHWKSSIFNISPEQWQQVRGKLSELAVMAINGKDRQERTIPRFWFRESLLKQVFGAIDDPICQLAVQVGLINQLGQTAEPPIESTYGFYHATFQEYFAALGVADWDYFLPRSHVNFPVKDHHYRIFASEWEQVILLWLGRGDITDKVKEEFIRKLVNFADGCQEFYEYQAYFLAGLAINEFKVCSLVDQIIGRIIKWGCGYFNEEKQEWQNFLQPIKEGAEKVLPRSLRAKVVNGLVQVLKSTNNTNWQVADTLGKIYPGNELAIQTLIHLLKSDPTRWQILYSLGKIAVGNELAIRELIYLLETTDNEDTCRRVSYSLGEIAVGNDFTIQELICILERNDNHHTCRCIADSLVKIAVGNELAIAELIRLLEKTLDYDTRILVIQSLGKIAVGNELAIAELIRLLEKIDDDFIRCEIAYSLGQIDPANEVAIRELIRLLENSEYNDISWKFSYFLEAIAVGSELAIVKLIDLLRNTDNDDILWEVVHNLGEIAVGNDLAIAELIDLLEKIDDGFMCCHIARSLGKINPGNKVAISKLIALIEKSQDNDIQRFSAITLVKIAVGNELAMRELIRLLAENKDNDNLSWNANLALKEIAVENKLLDIQPLINILKNADDNTRRQIATTLVKIAPENKLVIQTLISLLEKISDDDTCRLIINNLGKILPGNKLAITKLIRLLETTDKDDSWRHRYIASDLKTIICNDEQRKMVINSLKKYLNNKTYKNNFDFFEKCYEILWNISENLNYPDFYQAWHDTKQNQDLCTKSSGQQENKPFKFITDTQNNGISFQGVSSKNKFWQKLWKHLNQKIL